MTVGGRAVALSRRSAFDRYEAVRERLPVAGRRGEARAAADLGALTSHYDVFVFDGFGVLNVGETAVPGAERRVAALRAAGKRVFVLTNAARYGSAATRDKLAGLGFDFSLDEVVSSRAVCEAWLRDHGTDTLWGVAAADGSAIDRLPAPAVRLEDDAATYDRVGGFLLLSASGWTDARQARLVDSLRRRARRVLVANPDVVAPRETGLSLEPGFFAHALKDELSLEVDFHGKPFPSVFEAVEARLPHGVDRRRIAMVGDTLHTDILGANAFGWSSVLVSDYGVYAGADVTPLIERCGIVPDWVVPTM